MVCDVIKYLYSGMVIITRSGHGLRCDHILSDHINALYCTHILLANISISASDIIIPYMSDDVDCSMSYVRHCLDLI